MKQFFDEILDKHEVPLTVKTRLMESAKLYVLAKDLSGLFFNQVPKTSADIYNTVLDSKKAKPNKK